MDKLIPDDVKARGEWLTKMVIESKAFNPEPGHGEGATVSIAMSNRKEALVRNWAKGL